ELESFSYSVSHDLRAPLRHISGFVAMLRDEAGSALNVKCSDYLQLISSAAKRMAGLVEDLLLFSQMSRAEMRRRLVDMDDLVNEVVHEMKSDTEGRIIQWNIEPLSQLMGDRAMLKQVWANLLANAVKYTRQRERAEITIGCRDHCGEFEFYVQDNGAGFDMRYADKLFGVFQ